MERIHIMETAMVRIIERGADILPRAGAAFLLLVLGWLGARLVRAGTMKTLRMLNFDAFAERAGIEDFLLQGGVRLTAPTLIASILYWLILVAVVLSSLDLLGLGVAAELFNRIVLYIPKVLVAIVLLMFGLVFARFIREVVAASLNNIGVHGASIIATMAYWAIAIFAVSISLEELAIGGQLLVSAFQMAFGSLCLAMALAFGIGGRKWAERILEKLWD